MRYRMLIEYDGADFHGWQVQPKLPTIQEAIERALATALRHGVEVTGSGRTDAGVHARGQVAHFDSEIELDPFRLKGSLNGILPPTIAVRNLEKTHASFHARYDARWRRYHYYINTCKSPLSRAHRSFVKPAPDFALMNEAAKILLGEHDFSTFCRTKSETKNRICSIQEAEWTKECFSGHWVFAITANRFLHGMVRAIVGTLLSVGHGKIPPEALKKIMATRDRTNAGPAAPAHGLVLENVQYDT